MIEIDTNIGEILKELPSKTLVVMSFSGVVPASISAYVLILYLFTLLIRLIMFVMRTSFGDGLAIGNWQFFFFF